MGDGRFAGWSFPSASPSTSTYPRLDRCSPDRAGDRLCPSSPRPFLGEAPGSGGRQPGRQAYVRCLVTFAAAHFTFYPARPVGQVRNCHAVPSCCLSGGADLSPHPPRRRERARAGCVSFSSAPLTNGPRADAVAGPPVRSSEARSPHASTPDAGTHCLTTRQQRAAEVLHAIHHPTVTRAGQPPS